MHRWLRPSLFKIYGALLAVFLGLGAWLVADIQRGHDKVVADTLQRALQRSQIISQSFRAEVLAADYVLRDVLGRIQVQDLVAPDPDPRHAQAMTQLLKEKAATVPDFFSMVVFDKNCVFTATETGRNTGIRSKPALCEARRQHRGAGPLATYVPGKDSASGKAVIVLSRHLHAPDGEFLGGVLGVIEVSRAQHWFESLHLRPGDSVALLDPAQVLLARHPPQAQAIGQPLTQPAVPEALRAATAEVASAAQLDLDGRERLFGFSRVQGFPFVVAFGFDKAKAIEEWQRRVMELSAGYLILLILASLAAHSLWTTIRQREALRASEEHFRMLAENMADIVWRTDAQMRFTYINAADQRVRGFARDEVVGTALRDNLTEPGRQLLDARRGPDGELAGPAGQGNGLVLKLELPMRHKGGGTVWIEMSAVPIWGGDGHLTGYQGVGRDVSGRRQHEEDLLQSHQQLEHRLLEVAEEKTALQELATRDGLTGLYNRRFLDAALPRELLRAERERKPLALIMLDIDHFKKVNDQYGHAIGDEVLQALAELLKKGARESDLICRYGGEEFVALMPSMSASQALERTESWRRQLEDTTMRSGDLSFRITLSAGIAIFPDHGSSPSQLLTRADEMLYQSKHEGRNRVSVCPQV